MQRPQQKWRFTSLGKSWNTMFDGLNSGSATTAQQLRLSNYGSATTAQQPRLSNHGSATKLGSRFSNYASATTLQQQKLTLASATTAQQPKSTLASATKPQQPKPTPSGKYMHSLILHIISKSHPLLGKYMHSLIFHVISKSHPLRKVHAQSHLTRNLKIPPPLASTCTVSSYTSYQNPTPSGKYMHSLILHIISKSHPLWQVHAQSHLPRHIKIPPPLASTCTVSSSTSFQNPTPSGKYMHSLILHVISKSHPLWQVHAQSHLTRQIKIPPPLASTCTVSSYTSYQNPTRSGKYMQSLILHIISKSHPSGKYMRSLILHVISKSHPLWQLHAQSRLVSSYTSYQNPTPSGKYMHSLI